MISESRNGGIIVNRIRYPLLAASILLLLAAIWAGMVRLGWRWPVLLPALPISHGPLMVSGFLGTLIGLERAVALGARWAYLGPLATALGGILLIFRLGGSLGALLITFGSLMLVLIFLAIVRRHLAVYTVTMALGALVWLVSNLLWLSGRPIYQIVLWWAGFLILTIAGERRELGRLLSLSHGVLRVFMIIITLFLAGLVASLWLPDIGIRLAGLSMFALAIWLFRYDIARKTVRKAGLPRYTAICLLSGYFWLLVAGILILVYGQLVAGLQYDAYLHAIFLGFVFSMLFTHAPIIFPAVLGDPVVYNPFFYVFLIILQVSLTGRVVADLSGLWQARLWTGALNAIALTLFMGTMMFMVLRGRKSGEPPPPSPSALH
jgi:hypothetical protein